MLEEQVGEEAVDLNPFKYLEFKLYIVMALVRIYATIYCQVSANNLAETIHAAANIFH
jgi:hypothetical protein